MGLHALGVQTHNYELGRAAMLTVTRTWSECLWSDRGGRTSTIVPLCSHRIAHCSARPICCMAALKPLAVISGVARTHAIGRECAKVFLEVSMPLQTGLRQTGRQLTEAYLQAGYRVLGLDNAPQEDPALQHADYQFTSADIGSAEQVAQIAELVQQKGGVSVLLNNAGIADPYLPSKPDEKIHHWMKIIQTNLTGKQA